MQRGDKGVLVPGTLACEVLQSRPRLVEAAAEKAVCLEVCPIWMILLGQGYGPGMARS